MVIVCRYKKNGEQQYLYFCLDSGGITINYCPILQSMKSHSQLTQESLANEGHKDQQKHQVFLSKIVSMIQDFTNGMTQQAKSLIQSIENSMVRYFENILPQGQALHSSNLCPKGATQLTIFHQNHPASYAEVPLEESQSVNKNQEQKQLDSLSLTEYQLDDTQEHLLATAHSKNRIMHSKSQQSLQGDSIFIREIVENLNHQVERYAFIPRKNADYFSIEVIENKLRMKREDGKLMQVIAESPIDKKAVSKVGIRVIQSQKGWIYFGLMDECQLKEKSGAKAKNKRMVSYKISGGKQLHVLQQAEGISVPEIPLNLSLYMLTNYEEGKIQFLLEEQLIVTLKIDFQGRSWFPFITFKHQNDTVQLI